MSPKNTKVVAGLMNCREVVKGNLLYHKKTGISVEHEVSYQLVLSSQFSFATRLATGFPMNFPTLTQDVNYFLHQFNVTRLFS